MSPIWKPLAWDTEFFGFPIGSVDLNGATPASLAAVEIEAQASGIVCLYGSVDASQTSVIGSVQKHGYRFVDAATMFDLRQSEPPIAKPPDTTFRAGTLDDVPAVEDIALQMATWSRYAVDPRFGLEQAQRLQRAWLDRAARADDGVHSLMVAEEAGEITAFIGRVTTPGPRVDAVGTTRRGSGAARYLIEEARAWAGDVELLGGPIAARNVSALRYVSHCNYRVRHVQYLYHRWLDEDRSTP